jgi:hypothetical protein
MSLVTEARRESECDVDGDLLDETLPTVAVACKIDCAERLFVSISL